MATICEKPDPSKDTWIIALHAEQPLMVIECV